MNSYARWRRTLIGSSLLLAAGGIWLASSVLLVAAMAPIGFVAYATVTRRSVAESDLVCTRSVTPMRTVPGNTVKVILTIHYQGERLRPDIRVVDGVPDDLAVVGGSPRGGFTFNKKESSQLEYTVRARYGEFEFSHVTIVSRGSATGSSTTVELPADGDTQLRATYDPEQYPLSERTIPITGEITTDRGDEGLEFHSIRQYEPTDPASRINWRQYARERELSTIEYRAQEAAEVLTVVDARPSAGQAADPTAPTGTEFCVALASDIIDALLADRNPVGIATLGVDASELHSETLIPTDSDLAWLPPRNTAASRTQIQLLLDAAAATVAPQEETSRSNNNGAPSDPMEIIDRTTQQTQVIVFSPLCDAFPVELIEQLDAANRDVSVYSPAIVDSETAGGRIAAVKRELRVHELETRGISVVNWTPTESPELAVEQDLARRTQ